LAASAFAFIAGIIGGAVSVSNHSSNVAAETYLPLRLKSDRSPVADSSPIQPKLLDIKELEQEPAVGTTVAYRFAMRVRFAPWVVMVLSLLPAHGGASAEATAFPFELREGLIWVKVSAPNLPAPLNFLLDSGAGVSVLNLGTLDKLGLPLGRQVTVQGVGTSTRGYWPERAPLKAAGVSLPKDCLATDLTELSGACACRVDGLIGADFFRDRVVQIDFRAKVVRLLTESLPGNCRDKVPLKQRSSALLVPARINGAKTQWLRLDTGCASAVQCANKESRKANPNSRLAVGLATVPVAESLANVQFGDNEFLCLPVGFHSKPIFAGEAGLLGTGLLSEYASVTIDAKAGCVTLAR